MTVEELWENGRQNLGTCVTVEELLEDRIRNLCDSRGTVGRQNLGTCVTVEELLEDRI